VGDIEGTYLFAPVDDAGVRFTRKNDCKGLGYVSEDRLPRGKESWIERPAVEEKKKGDEYGVGVLNDDGEDGEDPYDIRSKRAYNHGIGSEKQEAWIVKRVRHGSVSKKVSRSKAATSLLQCHDERGCP